jgi:adenylyltransferase/sulfurtransferase
MTNALRDKRVLVVGAGGLGCPVASILARSGVGTIDVVDDDIVDISNVQRQTLFSLDDAGQPKAGLAAQRLPILAAAEGHNVSSRAFHTRMLPDNALGLIAAYDLVVEGSDNFASKFLIADACRIAGKSLVQAGAVRWIGWALGSDGTRGPCLRCVFEDVPRGVADTCATSGVVGPVVGVVGALQAAIALRMLSGESTASGELWRYTALDGRVRRTRIRRQDHCPLCAGSIQQLETERYVPAECAA